jgi:hypothetical protein
VVSQESSDLCGCGRLKPSTKNPSGDPVPDLMEWDIFLPHVLMCLKKAHRMNAKAECQRLADFSVTDGGMFIGGSTDA